MRDKAATSSGPTGASHRSPVRLRATVRKLVFRNPENGWSVVRMEAEEGGGALVAVGPLAGVEPGEQLLLTGRWEENRTYGRQLRVESFVPSAPASAEGIRRYLASGLFPGIGKVMAARVVERFGEAALEILEKSPERLREVPGIGPRKLARIRQAWAAHRALRDTMVFLQGHGLSPTYAQKVVRRYGAQATTVVAKEPYRLAEEIAGIGFAGADRIAASVGLAENSPERAAAGLLYGLRRAADQGHVYLPAARLLASTSEILGIPAAALEPALAGLAARGAVRREGDGAGGERIFLGSLWEAEKAVATTLARLAAAGASGPQIDRPRAIRWFERRRGLELAPEQRCAVERALVDRVLVITGGPGTGKTTLVEAVVAILTRKRQRLALAAPTGRAANRLAEATGAEVKTIHRLLEFDPHSMSFRRSANHLLEADVVIIDEASMLDIGLAASLVAALPDDARLILVGDVDQLPSVGPGKVLADAIAAGVLPVVRLEQIFRQHERSRIVVNAHRIHRGERPLVDRPESDFFFIRRQQPEAILETLLELATRRVPASFGLDPFRDVQTLTPMRRGLLGTENLNRRLQELLNPDPAAAGGRPRLGDRVMQIRNNYELDVFNGDVGRIVAVPPEDGGLVVQFDQRRVDYGAAHAEDLTLAYAATVHKSQGSEYPCVLVPLHTQHYVMLQRNLLYTAVTRASRLLILIGDPRALDIALGNTDERRRFTALAERLRASAAG